MPRPPKCRCVSAHPDVVFFKPVGVPMSRLDEIALTIDEYEAIRWADDKNLQHNEAAEKMEVSRPTFSRILARAHQKVATALVNGKALRINGGNYRVVELKEKRMIHDKEKQEWYRERARHNPR